MFDWDRDYAELVGAERAEHAQAQHRAQQAAPQFMNRDWMQRLSSARLFMAALAVCLIAGLTFEKRAKLSGALPRISGPQAESLFAAQADSVVVDTLPAELVMYDAAQYQRFMQGLQGMTAPDLHAYLRATRTDLALAPAALTPFYRDALFMLEQHMRDIGVSVP
ncbi:MAG: hypothetical protein EA386_11525 [Rhodobacteraceae bacterium]|nr:MAG: hypothetical protein EA386_11525 [Paracoccaceae bacterium]